MELAEIKKEDFDGIYRAMCEAFPYEERRDREAAEVLLQSPRYRVYHTVQDGVPVGFVTLWLLEDFTFLEHFVTYPAYRCRGYGSLVLAVLKERYGRLLLEAEPPDTPLAARRQRFYQREGFLVNPYPYVQPSYHGEGTGVPLVLMSYPAPLAAPEAAVSRLYREVYGR